MENKKAQVTIFVIIAVVVVAIIGLFFLFRGGLFDSVSPSAEIRAESHLHSCLKKEIYENLDKLMIQGSYSENKLNLTFEFDEEGKMDVSYLCYTEKSFIPCSNQEAILLRNLEKELKKSLQEKTKKCWNSYIENLENKNYEIKENYKDFQIKIVPEKIIMQFDADVSAKKTNETKVYKNPSIAFRTEAYNLLIVAQEILNQESRFCSFQKRGYMLFYPDYDIDSIRTINSDIIYTITHKKNGEKFRFAIRTCYLPPI